MFLFSPKTHVMYLLEPLAYSEAGNTMSLK